MTRRPRQLRSTPRFRFTPENQAEFTRGFAVTVAMAAVSALWAWLASTLPPAVVAAICAAATAIVYLALLKSDVLVGRARRMTARMTRPHKVAVLIGCAVIAWGAWLVPTLPKQEDAGPASEGTKTAEVETSVGVTNVTNGDTQYTGAVGASTNDRIKVQIYLRNMDIEQPLNDAVVRWQTEELKDGLYVVTSTVITETGNEYMADAAIYVWTDTPAKRPALVGDTDWGEVLRYPDTDGEYREQLVRSSSELTGSVEIPALSAAAGRDAITLTTNLRADEE